MNSCGFGSDLLCCLGALLDFSKFTNSILGPEKHLDMFKKAYHFRSHGTRSKM